MTAALPWRAMADGVALAVRVTPNASRSEAAGIVDCGDGRVALAVRVAAPPVDGAANAALIAYLARQLALRKSAISVNSGESGRLKRLSLTGDAATIMARLGQPPFTPAMA